MTESKPERTDPNTQELSIIPTIQEMETWNKEKVLRWIQQRDPIILKGGDLDNFNKAHIGGYAFLLCSFEFLHTSCGLSPRASLALNSLVDEVKEEGKLSKQTAGRKRKENETDAPESPVSPKRNRQEDPLSEPATRVSEQRRLPNSKVNGTDVERVERAVKRRARILQEIKTISQLPDAVPLPDAAVPLSYAELSNAAVQLSSPAVQIKLPFPFVEPSLPERFNYNGDHHYWDYMGREKFTELLDAVKELETTARQGYLFYGTIGYGRSHLLAALTCYLITAGKRVIYIPDCRACAWSPVRYFRAAMLLAWGGPDDSVIRESIMALDTMTAMAKFFKERSNILFILDHVNILEKDPSGIDPLSDKRKDEIFTWIKKCVANHKYIFGASAENSCWAEGKRPGAQRLLAYGGFSATEMQQWWDRNEKLIPGGYTKDEIKDFKSKVEDLTGSIPLLLKKCVVDGKIDLSANALEGVATQVRIFMTRIKLGRDATAGDWDIHCEYVRACISGQPVMDDTPSNLIDDRYFYAEAPDLVGRYACGIARDAAARQLRRYKVDKFGDTDFLMALNVYIDNPSVTGFFIEQAILSSIASRGLEISQGISKKMDTVIFPGSIPILNTTKSDPVLYCPININSRGADGIIARFTEGKCYMFPLQITVAKSHSDSEEIFFREWNKWTNNLYGIEIVLMFIWITKESSEINIVPPVYRSTKSGKRLVRPSYCTQKVPLERVNLDIWERYQQALGKLPENSKGWVENECLSDDQAPLDASEAKKVGRGKGGGKSGDGTIGGEEQRESEKPEGVEEPEGAEKLEGVEEPEGAEKQARSGGPSATARPSIQEAREGCMKMKVPELRKPLKNRSKPRLVDRLLVEDR